MSVTDGKASGGAMPDGREGHKLRKEVLGVMTLAGALVLTTQYRNILKIDPGGASRNVDLPVAENGAWFKIVNAADAAENLVVRLTGAGSTIVTVNQNEEADVYCDGTTWTLLCVRTIALS